MSALQRFVEQRIASYLRTRGRPVPEDIREAATVRVAPARDAAGFRWIRVDAVTPLAAYHVRVNATTGERMAWMCDALRVPASGDLPIDECLRIATEAAQAPQDAVLEEAKYESFVDSPYFVATWIHVVRGLPVDGDWIRACVNGKIGVCYAVSRKWHEPDEEPSLR